MEEKKVLLSARDLVVNFHVRGRTLTAIRGISLDIYEGESIAIVGESGSGKSVFTKTFANMLDDNGYIEQGSIIFNDPELADTTLNVGPMEHKRIQSIASTLDGYAKLENGAVTYRKMQELKSEKLHRETLSDAEYEAFETQLADLRFQRTELFNQKQTFDTAKEKEKIKAAAEGIKALDEQIKALEKKREDTAKAHKTAARQDTAYQTSFRQRMEQLKQDYAKEINLTVSPENQKRNLEIAKEIYLSVGRYNPVTRERMIYRLLGCMKKAMRLGVNLNSD